MASRRRRKRKCKQLKKRIPADIIEEAVLYQIYSLFGDKEKLDQALLDATPDHKLRPKIEEEIELLKRKLTGIKTKKGNLLDMVADGGCDAEDIKEKMDALKEQEKNLNSHISTNRDLIKSIPSSKELKKRSTFAKNVLRVIKERKFKSVEHLASMSWEDRRQLVQTLFTGISKNGEKNGVYIHREDDKWHYEINGTFSHNIS